MTQSFDFGKDNLLIYDLLSSFYQITESLRLWAVRFLGRLGATILFLCVWIFAVAFFWLIYHYLKSNRKTIEVNFDNYLAFKKQQIILREKIHANPILSIEKVNQIHFLVRLPFLYMALSTQLVLEYQKELDRQLQALDKTCPHNSNFTQSSQERLWENRNKAYNYFM